MKKLLSVLLTMVMLCGLLVPFAAMAADATTLNLYDEHSHKTKSAGDWEYYEEIDGIALTRCYADDRVIKVPRYIDGKKVIKIVTDDYRFSRQGRFFKKGKTKHLILSNTVQIVEIDAFAYDSLETISIGKNVRKLTNFTNENLRDEDALPSTLKKIKVHAKNKTYKSKGGVLYNKKMTILYKYPRQKKCKSFTVPKTVKTISAFAFSKANCLKKVKLPRGLKTIEGGAFFGAKNITVVELPRGLEILGSAAFSGCKSLQKVTSCPNLSSIGYDLFHQTPFAKRLRKNAGKNRPVYWNKALLEYNGKAPKILKIKAGTHIIAPFALSGQKKLTKLILPNSVKCIEICAISDCPKLKTIKTGNRIQAIDSWAFARTPFWDNYLKKKKGELIYYKGILMGCKGLYNGMTSTLKKVQIKGGTRTIADQAFLGLFGNLSNGDPFELVLPRGLKAIGSFAFYGCNKINKMTIPKSVTYIGEDAFLETDIEFTVTKDSYAHKYLKKNGFKKIVVTE